VILPHVRGSEGYGKTYLNADNGPKREDSVKDIGACWTGSRPSPTSIPSASRSTARCYGGYMSLASMTHYSDRPGRRRRAYGISDFTTFLERTEAYRRDNRRAEYGDERTPEMKAVFARINPMANVAKIRKPMQVMQGRPTIRACRSSNRSGRRPACAPTRRRRPGTSCSPMRPRLLRSPTTTCGEKWRRVPAQIFATPPRGK
jgi:hypothetical protein